MKDLVGKALLSSGVMLLTAGSVLAHHSAAMFDDRVELTFTGVVTRFDYLNPHAWLYVDVTLDSGAVTEWGFELEAPPRLRRQGISPKFWQVGDLVTVKTHPLKDGRPAGHLSGIIKSDGTTYGDSAGLTAPES